jgi:4-diphosphocytidyl-2C-methyl-D-erythritol kinase
VLLVHDKTKIKTQKVFSNYKGNFLKKVSIDNGDIVNNLQKFENSLEQTILSLAPQLNEILVKLKLTNPKISGISGSGAVCFGLYGSYEEAQNAMYVMSSTCKELLFMLSKVQF